jgi:hypothetical protein
VLYTARDQPPINNRSVIKCIFQRNRCKTSVRTRHDDTRDEGDKPDSDDRGYNTKHTRRGVRDMTRTMQTLESKIQNYSDTTRLNHIKLVSQRQVSRYSASTSQARISVSDHQTPPYSRSSKASAPPPVHEYGYFVRKRVLDNFGAKVGRFDGADILLV